MGLKSEQFFLAILNGLEKSRYAPRLGQKKNTVLNHTFPSSNYNKYIDLKLITNNAKLIKIKTAIRCRVFNGYTFHATYKKWGSGWKLIRLK